MTLAAVGLAVSLARRPVLSDVAVRIVPGRITGLIGPNGAGKSTLLRALAGLVTLDAGSVTLDGRSIAGLSRRDLARAIAFLPQERTVHWPLAARAVVALGRIPHRSGPAGEGAADARAIDEAMAAMDIVALADRPVGELSGGERGRVLFARALAQKSAVILADEPTAGLDPAHALGLLELLNRLAAEGRAIAIALHDLSLAARFCHDVVVLSRGRVAAAGPRAEVMTAERLAAVFGVGFAMATLDGLPIVVPIGTRPNGGLSSRG